MNAACPTNLTLLDFEDKIIILCMCMYVFR